MLKTTFLTRLFSFFLILETPPQYSSRNSRCDRVSAKLREREQGINRLDGREDRKRDWISVGGLRKETPSVFCSIK
jgi:hypothetical protein